MKPLNILIVEDEVLIAEDLHDIIKSFGYKNIKMAHTKSDAIALLNQFYFDVVLLDIRMEKELDGLELGTFINKALKIPFMYITAHSDIAMIKEILKTKPAAYITKPIKKSDLFANLNLIESQRTENKSLIIKDGYNSHKILFEEINYIEGEGNYINIYSQSKKIVIRQSMDSIMEELDASLFFRIHRSYIVNLKKITKFSKKEVEIGTVQLPISRKIASEFESIINSIRS